MASLVSFLNANDWFRAPFGASHFNNPTANSLTLEFEVTGPVLEKLRELDQQIVALAIKQKTFPDKTDAEVASSYHSLLVAAPKIQPSSLPDQDRQTRPDSNSLLEAS